MVMVGGRITSEERSTLSTYIGLGVVTVLAAGAVYFFILSHQEKKEAHWFRSESASAERCDFETAIKTGAVFCRARK